MGSYSSVLSRPVCACAAGITATRGKRRNLLIAERLRVTAARAAGGTSRGAGDAAAGAELPGKVDNGGTVSQRVAGSLQAAVGLFARAE